MPRIPILNMEYAEAKELFFQRVQEPHMQRKLVLVIVSIALLLDNMLYMVIVPIIPDYLRRLGSWDTHVEGGEYVTEPNRWHVNSTGNYTVVENKTAHLINGVIVYENEDSAIGVLFASKAIVQLMVNPFSGALIDRVGYELPMMIGLAIMFFSTAVFACGRSYGILFFARSLQGVGSAFADTSGLAMIADRFTEESERTKALGIALAFISFGCLVAPPFGGLLYEFAGKEFPFLVLSLVCLADGFMLRLVMKPYGMVQLKEAMNNAGNYQGQQPVSIPIWRLLMDPYIAVCAGALMMSNVSLAFLEPTISVWMMDNMDVKQWQLGMIWLPAFVPHVAGVILTVKMARQYPQYQWAMAAGGLALEGLCCLIVPFARSYWVLMIPICGICFGIALIDTALLPMLGYLVDVRYVSVYGSIYAIADISYSMAYAIGPIIAGGVVESIGFLALNIGIAVSNLLYCPVLMFLRHIYDYKPFEDDEANVLMSDPPEKQYQTYTLQDTTSPVPVSHEKKNHLEYGKSSNANNGKYSTEYAPFEETNVDQGYVQGNGENGYANFADFNSHTSYEMQQRESRTVPPPRPALPQHIAMNPISQPQSQPQTHGSWFKSDAVNNAPKNDTNPFR